MDYFKKVTNFIFRAYFSCQKVGFGLIEVKIPVKRLKL